MSMDASPSEILSLVRSKNRCLERLMEVTQSLIALPPESILEPTESTRSSAQPATPIDLYDRERIATVKTLEMFDRKISELITSLTEEQKKSEEISNIRSEMTKNEQLIHSIFSADDVVFDKLGQIQRDLAREISENRKSRDILMKFRSQQQNASHGEEVDTTL